MARGWAAAGNFLAHAIYLQNRNREDVGGMTADDQSGRWERAMPRKNARIDQFLLIHSARADNWREITTLADAWAAGRGERMPLEAAIAEMEAVEEFHAYPGARLLAALTERIAANDSGGAANLARRISNALLTRAYRDRPGEWDVHDEGAGGELANLLPPTTGDVVMRRPYFEVLFVNSQPAARWPAFTAEVRRLRRPEDAFIYEPVMAGSFEDALCSVALNPDIISVVLAEGFPYRSRRDAPVLRSVLDPLGESEGPDMSALRLSRALKRIRPELDIYLLSDRQVETLAGDPAADAVRRIFYAVEELLELHLAILEGVQDRYETPFFDNLKKYARRPIGTFHALPIARGKSVFKSDWIRDMGEFYGLNLFLAESSATTGGLDSLLEPTGTIKRRRTMAARAFGADRVFFVTNGTSTSNKMAVQALLAPGDIAVVDRNCHKSHHYGMVLTGAQPLLRRSVPDDGILDVRSGATEDHQARAAGAKAEGRLERMKLLDLTNCTFDGHMYNVAG
jgi:arginine decarboxylase